MSRGNAATGTRCLVLWLAVTGAAVAAVAALGGSAVQLLRSAAWQAGFDALLADLASLVLIGCAAWLWLVTTVTTAEVAAGRAPTRAPGMTRRLVLVACGVALVAGSTTPAFADGTRGDPAALLAGLSLPDRVGAPVASPGRPLPERSPAGDVVVRPGDSLWSLAAGTLPAGATALDVDARWRALYLANRAVVGADPDLIRPGQRLHLPGALPTTPTDQ